MANEIKLLGRNEILFIYTPIKNASGTVVAEDYFPIGCLTTNDISKTNNTTDGTITKCDINPAPTYNNQTYQLTFEAVAVEDDGLKSTYDDISTLMDSSIEDNEPVFFKIETEVSTGIMKTKFGKALITELTRTAPAEGEITYSGTLQGIGKLSDTDLNV